MRLYAGGSIADTIRAKIRGERNDLLYFNWSFLEYLGWKIARVRVDAKWLMRKIRQRGRERVKRRGF